MTIATECRRESHQEIKKETQTRRNQILLVLAENKKPMTASEIALELMDKHIIARYDRNYVSPRLREAYLLGLVNQVNKKKCPVTGKLVTVWALRGES